MEATIELVDLKNKFKLIRSRAIIYNDQAKKYIEERNSLNRKITEMIHDSKSEKRKRDELNKKVLELKKDRDSIRTQLNGLLREFQENENQSSKKSGRNISNQLKKQIIDVEWALQTKKLSPAEEETIKNRIDELEAKLSQFKSETKNFQEQKRMESEIEEIKAKEKVISKLIFKFSQESQVHHNRMHELLELVDNEIRVKADEAHKKFIEAKQKADELYLKSETLIPRINEIMHELGEFQNMKNVKIDKVQEVMENRVDNAVKKFKSGKRLTLEEFTLLVKRGML